MSPGPYRADPGPHQPDAGLRPSDVPTLLPAVDIAAGRADQVVDGGTDDPFVIARGWVEQGAQWVHLVDLDRAFRRGENLALLTDLISALPVPVQLSGGLDTPEAVEAALGTGAARINLAVTALRPAARSWVGELIAEQGSRLCVGLDIHDERIIARGSGEDLGLVDDLLRELTASGAQPVGLPAKPAAYLVADATRDGRRTGADRAMFADMVHRLNAPVIASGGVASLDDLSALARAGVAGIVLGAALYHGAFTLTDALSHLQGHSDAPPARKLLQP